MDPEKLKVVDLRKELQQRGLDTKGNKAVLVQRLREALEEEGDSTQATTAPTTEAADDEENEEEAPKPESKTELKTPRKERAKTPTKAARKEMPPTPARRSIRTPSKTIKEEPEEEKEEEKPETKPLSPVKEDPKKIETSTEMETETRGEKRKREDDDEEEEGTEKKRREESPERTEEKEEEKKEEVKEKPAPREEEPTIDFDKVHLSWLDSDLNLKIDQENFLSARPINSNCFGYLWAGARGSHGISQGKVCFEVKITEEIPWEDPADKMQEKLEKTLKDNKFRIDRRKENAAKKTEGEEKKDGDKEGNVEENGKEEEEEEKAEVAESQQKEDEQSAENKSEEAKPVDKEEEKQKLPPIPTHYLRVGFSLKNSPLQLGEAPHSYAYENTGKFLHNKQFQDYGPTFAAGDVIGSFLNIGTDKVTISYTKNGELVGEAISLPKSELPEDFALFPHVLCRNFAYEVNFGGKEAWFARPNPLKDYPFIEELKEKVDGPRRVENRDECEVLLMVGLPGSGKTHWVNNHLATSKDKQYTVIGNNPLLFDRMTVEAEPIKSRFPGSWKALVDQVQKCLNQFIDMAGKRRRNYIIDQTNFNSNAQRRKLRNFEGFQRKAVILVCDEEEHKRRLEEQHKDGKLVPESTMYELKAAMELPEKSDFLEDIIFAELGEEEARKKVKDDREDANKKGYYKRQNVKFDNRRGVRGRGRLARGAGFPGRFQRGGPWRPVPPMWGGRRGAPPPRGPQGAWRPPQRDQRSVRGFGNAQNRPVQSWNGGWGQQNAQGGNKNGWNASMYSGQSYGGWNQNQQGQTSTWKYPQTGYNSAQTGYNAGQSGYNSGGQRSYNSQQQYGTQQGYGYGNNYGSWNQGQGYGQGQQQSWNYYGQYGQNQSGWGNNQRR